QDRSQEGIFGQRFASNGDRLGAEFPVTTFTSLNQSFPSVSSDAAGNFVVVWDSYNQDAAFTYGIFGQRYAADGTPRGGEFRINSHTQSDQRHPSVSLDADGDFVVVWAGSNQDGDGEGIFGQRYASSGMPQGGEFRLNTYTTGFQYYPTVTMDAA